LAVASFANSHRSSPVVIDIALTAFGVTSDPRLTELGTFWFEMAVFEFAAL
jgi:hypothetical protein